MPKYIIVTEFGELLDLACTLKYEGHDVEMYIPDHNYKKIGDGIIDKTDDWYSCIGKGYIWVFDGCSHGRLQDWLRERGEAVFGGSEQGDKLENDRQLGQKLFKAAGFHQVESKNFKDINEAIKYVKDHSDGNTRLILKQNGDAPKSINHKAKFHDNTDLLYHLEKLKKTWNDSLYGAFDCDLMHYVKGLEVAASAFFNGKDWMRNKDGKVVGFLNFEEKKEIDGGVGETVGEMGTTFIGVTEDNKMFKDIIMRPKIKQALEVAKFRGVFDINCIQEKETGNMVALEATCRFGIPATSYEFCAAMDNVGETIKNVAMGLPKVISIKMGIGMVLVVAAKPYPVEADLENEATSIGEKLWILNGKEHAHRYPPLKDFTDDQKKRIHLENFYKEDGEYKVATKNGYLYTVTGFGNSISEVRDDIMKYIHDNVYVSNQKYRSDIGQRVEEHEGISKEQSMAKKYENKMNDMKEKHQKEIETLKGAVKEILYDGVNS